MEHRDDSLAEERDEMRAEHAPGYWSPLPHLVRRREPLVELPAFGRPSRAERNWRAVAAGQDMEARRTARLQAITIDEWIAHLEGDDVAWALRAVRYLRTIVARHEERIVLRAIDRGLGWDAIGAVLGVSRQAVAQRFGRLVDEVVGVPTPGPDRASAPDRPDRAPARARRSSGSGKGS